MKGSTLSCGCFQRERASAARRKHGGTGTPEYRAWKAMKDRCGNPNNPQFRLWGGRGIEVCEQWAESFDVFLSDMGARPSKSHSVDRVDVDSNYSPGNCRWATAKEQSNNTRRNVIVRHQGEVMTLRQFADAIGVKYATVVSRRYQRRLGGAVVAGTELL